MAKLARKKRSTSQSHAEDEEMPSLINSDTSASPHSDYGSCYSSDYHHDDNDEDIVRAADRSHRSASISPPPPFSTGAIKTSQPQPTKKPQQTTNTIQEATTPTLLLHASHVP